MTCNMSFILNEDTFYPIEVERIKETKTTNISKNFRKSEGETEGRGGRQEGIKYREKKGSETLV